MNAPPSAPRRVDESMTLLTEILERPLDPAYGALARRRVAAGLPEAACIINLCEDRYRFLVAYAAALAREPGRVFTRGQLLDVLHGVAFESYERAIDAHIKNLRRKIEVALPGQPVIHAVYGIGYRLEID